MTSNSAFPAAPRAELQAALDQHFSTIPHPEILEAGCGSGSNVKLPAGCRITGIDISREELDKNSIVTEKIVGDLQTYELPPDHYELIICWDVLEHLDKPELAMMRMTSALKPGGLLLLAFPNVHSVKALVAKATPLWFHNFVYRRIYGAKFGTPGVIPFPTYLRWSIARSGIERFAGSNRLSPLLESTHESGVQRRFRAKLRMGNTVTRLIERSVRIVSFGKFTVTGSDCIYLLQKESGPAKS
jgi:SAM-dependent methyltransferase